MIDYDRKNWIKAVTSIRGTAARHAAGRILGMTVYAVALEAIYEAAVTYDEPRVKAIFGAFEPAAHAMLGTFLGFLLVFRMNASNGRYWEGRTAWGQIINASRNLVRVGVVYTDNGRSLADLVTGYVICLRRALQGNFDMHEADNFLPADLCRRAEQFGNPPTAVAYAISAWIETENRRGTLDSQLVRHMEDQLSNLVDAQGACEKIRKTPLPFVYVVMLKQLIMVYLIALPFALAARCGWWSPVIMAMAALSLFGIEEASVEIEDPFGPEDNCLDMAAYTLTIARDCGQMATHKT
jgi:ion channel-forming bestrophin family protein